MIFRSENHMVETYLATIDKSVWTVYPETGDFDLLLSRNSDGFQIGIEAKLSLNTKVICQAADLAVGKYGATRPGPDCRAVLVPYGKRKREQDDYASLLQALQIVVLRVGGRDASPWVNKALPAAPDARSEWPEHFPYARIQLPDYVPDVAAGVKGPTKLTLWKVKAIKLVVLLRSRGYLVRRDFARFEVSPSTWTQRGWLVPGQTRGQWVEGAGIPDFEAQHPVNFIQIRNDMDKWNARDPEFY